MGNISNTDLNSVKSRLISFIDFKGLSQGKFEKMTNLSNGYVNNIINTITDKTFEAKIRPVFPELNKIWLLHGSGSMLEKDNNIPTETIKKGRPFNELPIEDKLNMIFKKQLELETKMTTVMSYIDDHLDPLFEYMRINSIDEKKSNQKARG